MSKHLFIAAREFIAYAAECYHTPNPSTIARFLARKVQLRLTPIPDRAWLYVDRVEEMVLAPRDERPQWAEVEAALISFAAYIQPELKE